MADPASQRMPAQDPRRCRLLDAAVTVFTRFGFRKTSMDEVARAAGVSRQGLYLHFTAKEELFRSAVEHALSTALSAALDRLGDGSASLEERLVGAFDEWVGRYAGAMGAEASDLMDASGALLGPMLAEHEERFIEAVSKAIRASGLTPAHRAAGLTARQLAETLNATARGLKHGVPSRDAFGKGMEVAVRAVFAALQVKP